MAALQLRLPRDQVAKRITQLIDEGRSFADLVKPRTEPTLGWRDLIVPKLDVGEDASVVALKLFGAVRPWRDFAIAFLNAAFRTPDVAEAFKRETEISETKGPNGVATAICAALFAGINNLTSLRRRLAIATEQPASSVAVATAGSQEERRMGELAKLREPRASASESLDRRIAEGNKIRDVVDEAGRTSMASPQLELEAETKFQVWDDYNFTMLQKMFEGTEIAREYRTESRLIHPGGDVGNLPRFWVPSMVAARCRRLKSVRERLELFEETPRPASSQATAPSNRVFVVHGRDERFPGHVESLLRSLGLDPVVLKNKANEGAITLIEKLVRYGDVAYAVVIYTPDDSGALAGNAPTPRARENVVLELGYFVGRLGRERVCLLLDPAANRPSDFDGVAYVSLDAGGGWKAELVRELKAAALPGVWSKFP